MQVNIKQTDVAIDDELKAYVMLKTEAFQKLLEPGVYDAAICDVELRHSTHHQKGDVCYVEVNLEADGKLYRASKTEKTFEKAVDKVKDDVLQALRSNKTRARRGFLKGAARVKEWFRGSDA